MVTYSIAAGVSSEQAFQFVSFLFKSVFCELLLKTCCLGGGGVGGLGLNANYNRLSSRLCTLNLSENISNSSHRCLHPTVILLFKSGAIRILCMLIIEMCFGFFLGCHLFLGPDPNGLVLTTKHRPVTALSQPN